MRQRMLTFVAAVTVLGVSSASAQIVFEPVELAESNRIPAVGPYQFTGSGATLESGMLYTNTIETGSRFNPGTGGDPLGSGTQQDITFDDIPIPAARLAGQNAIDVTRITVGIRRAGNAPATDINLFWSTATTGPTAPNTELNVPFFPVGSQALAARSEAAFITQLVTFGDGVNPLFTASLNDTLFSGHGTFMLGLQFSNGDALNGWRLTNGPDLNANVMWLYDSDVTPETGSFNFGTGGPSATFYITVEGTPIPEPASLSMLACASLLALRRRR